MGDASKTELTRLLHDTMPLARLLDLHVIEGRRDHVALRSEWREDHRGAGPGLHGGFLLALADTAGGSCSFLNLPQSASATVTIESNMNFFRPVTSGAVIAVSRPLHLGRSTIVIESDVFDESGAHVARALQTQAVLT